MPLLCNRIIVVSDHVKLAVQVLSDWHTVMLLTPSPESRSPGAYSQHVLTSGKKRLGNTLYPNRAIREICDQPLIRVMRSEELASVQI